MDVFEHLQNVSVAGAKGENSVWGWGQWGRVSAASVGVPQNVQEMS